MNDLSRAAWRTSSYSNIGGNCVEAATVGGVVGVRDTKDRAGTMISSARRPGSAFPQGEGCREGLTRAYANNPQQPYGCADTRKRRATRRFFHAGRLRPARAGVPSVGRAAGNGYAL